MILKLNDKIITNKGAGTIVQIQGDSIEILLTNGDKRTITNHDIVALQQGDSYKWDMNIETFPR